MKNDLLKGESFFVVLVFNMKKLLTIFGKYTRLSIVSRN